MAMVMKKHLNTDICNMINNIVMNDYKKYQEKEDFKMWRKFLDDIDDVDIDKYGNFLYLTQKSYKSKDEVLKDFWYLFAGSIEEDEHEHAKKVLFSDKDRFYNAIIDGYDFDITLD